MEEHRLTPLLNPKSIALVGASRRRDTPGNDVLRDQQVSSYKGRFYSVNPRYQDLYGEKCYASIGDLPEPVDLVILSVPNSALEAQLQAAVDAGARAAVIFGSATLEEDVDPPLAARLQKIARAAGVPICGGNCMGFFNVDSSVRAFAFHLPDPVEAGPLTFITQSGSALSAYLFNEPRMRFNLAVSPGQELVTTAADFMDYALDQPTTKVIALILEAVRDPDNFVAVLERARAQRIPVIALKLGRTEASAALALSHSGAISGNDAAYEAVFSRYGVIRVNDMDEFAATALLLCQGRPIPPGGLAAIMDSGGEREMLVDLAEDLGVPFAKISPHTTQILAKQLDPGLEPVNPLDAWGTGRDYEAIFENCLKALMDDPDSAVGMFVADMTSGFYLHEGYAEAVRGVARRTKKPVCVMTNYSAWTHKDLAMRLTRANIPVLDGTVCALQAVRHALEYRDFLDRPSFEPLASVADAVRERWRDRLAPGSAPLDEHEGLALLADYGVAGQRSRVVETLADAVAAAEEFGYPVVLKTAMPGILHKTEVGGVKLKLADGAAVEAAYRDLSERLGARVLVGEMVGGTVEMAFGVVNDPLFGPFVMIATGGTWIEVLKDRQVALAPVDPGSARRRIDALKMRKLLDGVRGDPPCDIDGLAESFTRLSILAEDLGDLIAEMDVNPVKVGPLGAVAVDALVVPHRS